MDWNSVANDREQWRVFLNTVIKLLSLKKFWAFLQQLNFHQFANTGPTSRGSLVGEMRFYRSELVLFLCKPSGTVRH